jgi:hypothetical protein
MDFAFQIDEGTRGPVVRLAGELDLASILRFDECLRDLG